MEIDRSLNTNTKLARAPCVLVHGTHGVPTAREGTTAGRRLPSAPADVELAGTPVGDSVTCQRALISDSANDEQWSDDLSIPSKLDSLPGNQSCGKART